VAADPRELAPSAAPARTEADPTGAGPTARGPTGASGRRARRLAPRRRAAPSLQRVPARSGCLPATPIATSSSRPSLPSSGSSRSSCSVAASRPSVPPSRPRTRPAPRARRRSTPSP
jgi:hypothetical protein